MGCGKSKHAVETATTIVKSNKSDCGKETRTTKTITEKGDASVVQHEVETKSLVVEDMKKESVTTKLAPSSVATIDNVPPKFGEKVEKSEEAVKEDEKVKDSNVTNVNDVGSDNVGPTLNQNIGKEAEIVKGDETVEDSNPTNANDANKGNMVITSSEDDVGVAEVVTEDKEKKESNVTTDKEAKTENENFKRLEEIKVSNPTKDNVKNEFMTPTLSEDILESTKFFKDDEKLKNSKEENIESAIPDELETIDDSSDPIDNSPKGDEEDVVEPTLDLKEVETNIEEDVEVTEEAIDKVETSPAAISPQVTSADEANAVEMQEKEP